MDFVDIIAKTLLNIPCFFLALTIGRLTGGIVLNWLKASTFLILSTAISIVGILGIFTGLQWAAITGFFVIGLGFANIFPLIFSLTIDKMPQRANELSGLMITAIVGGAIMPVIMGTVADIAGMTIGFIVPLAGILYIGWIALKSKNA